MTTQNFETLSTDQLKRWKNITTFALFAVWIGAAIAITASFYRLYVDGDLATTTFIVSLLALVASIPAYQEKKKIEQELNRREGYVF